MSKHQEDFSFKNYFVPLTTLKAIHFIILIGLIIYFNSLFNGFVGDDFGQLVDNPYVHTISNIPHFFFGGSFNDGSGGVVGIYYKPLMVTFFSLIYSFFGANPFFFHLFQLSLHIANTILVFFLFKHFFKINLGFILSLIFLVHPINNEAVVYISNLQDVLFFFFGMVAVLFSLKTYSIKNFLLIIIFLLLSLLSKTTGLALLAIVFLGSLIFNHQLLKKNAIFLPLLFIFYIIIHILVVGIGFSKDQPFPIMRLSFLERLITIPSIIFFYIKMFVFPKDLAIGYQGVVKTISFENFYLPILVITSFVSLWSLLLYIIKKNKDNLKKLLFFSVWFVIGLLFHIQIIPLDFVVADRWFYFPIIGLLGIIGIAITIIKVDIKKYGLLVILLPIIIISILSIRSFIRNLDFKDGLTLASHDTQIVKDSYSLYAYYGVELYNAARYDEAIANLKKSIELAPYWHLNWNYLGQTYERKGALTKNRDLIQLAEKSYKKAIQNSNYDTPSVNYAHLLVYYYDSNTSRSFIKESLKKYPTSSGLWYNLAILEIIEKNNSEAKLAIQKAYTLNPANRYAYNLLFYLENDKPVIIEKANF